MSIANVGPFDITTVAVFCASTTADEAAALMRRAVEALVALEGVSFFKEQDRQILERPDGLAPEWTKKPVFLTDAASSYAVLLHHFWRPEASYHYLVIGPDSDVGSEELDREWRLLTGRAEQVLAALTPDVAVGFAQLPAEESDPVNYGEICPGGSKRVLTPWTFFGPRSLDDKTRQLFTILPGVSTKSVGDGLLMITVTTPGTAPDPQFRKALDALGNVEYVDPLLAER